LRISDPGTVPDARRLATHLTTHICHLAYFRELFRAGGHMPDGPTTAHRHEESRDSRLPMHLNCQESNGPLRTGLGRARGRSRIYCSGGEAMGTPRLRVFSSLSSLCAGAPSVASWMVPTRRKEVGWQEGGGSCCVV
jgi:hypothetical protein